MEVNTKKPKTAAEIAAEIERLNALKLRVRRYSQFGDDNHAAIDAQITTLTQRLTRDQVRKQFPEDGADKLFMALIASDWMHGELLGDEDTPPSQDWPQLEPITAEAQHG